MYYKFCRSFLPIGQGAFYLEEHWRSGEEDAMFRVVYDCGSQKPKEWVKERVKSCLGGKKRGKGLEVDVLFLSHYHVDHYKGIEFLKPKTIVLPLLNDLDRLILTLGRKLSLSDYEINYDDRLRRLFPNARFIYVEALDQQEITEQASVRSLSLFNSEVEEKIQNLESDIQDFIDTLDKYEFSELVQKSLDDEEREIDGHTISKTEERINSGKILEFPYGPDMWNYILVNPGLDGTIINKLRQPKIRSKIDKLLPYTKKAFLPHAELLQYKKELKEFYKAIGTPNEYSMVIYSGPKSCETGEFYARRNRPIPVNAWLIQDKGIRFLISSLKTGLGCLYLGDISLRGSKYKRFSKTLKKVYEYLPNQVAEDLSTIQVPHHGSGNNYDNALLHYYDKDKDEWERWNKPMTYVISAGKHNGCGHPAVWVINDLMQAPNLVRIVSEDVDSIFVEEGEYGVY